MSKKAVQPCRAKTCPARSQCKASYQYNSIRVQGPSTSSSWLGFPADSVPTKSQKDNSVSIKAAAWLSPLLHDMFDEGAENEIEVLI